MNKKILAVCDLERSYAERLVEYLEQKQRFPFEIRTFLDTDQLLKYCMETKEIELLLISESAYRRELESFPNLHIMILNESGSIAYPEYKNVDKYQAAGGIVREVMSYCAEHLTDTAAEPLITAGMRMIGLYSPVRRCMQTSYALTLGQILAKRYHVLYINLEGYSGFSKLFSIAANAELTELVYYAQHLEGKLLYQIEGMVQRIGELDYVPPVLSAGDLSAVSGEEWKNLLMQIAAKCRYDYILLDLSDQVRGLFEILRMCNTVYTIVEDDPRARAKLEEYVQDLVHCGYQDVREKTVKCSLPWIEQLPEETELLPFTKLGDYVRTQLKEMDHG